MTQALLVRFLLMLTYVQVIRQPDTQQEELHRMMDMEACSILGSQRLGVWEGRL